MIRPIALVLLVAWSLGAPRASGASQSSVNPASTTLEFPGTANLVPIVTRQPFAVVNWNGLLEGSRSHGQLLYRHYAFGWQLLDIEAGRLRPCDLRAFAVPAEAIAALLRNSAAAGSSSSPCPSGRMRFAVSKDEEAIRALMQHQRQSIPSVVQVDNYAVAGWEGAGGGEALFRKSKGRWTKVIDGGGVLDACEMKTLGASPQIARKLIVMTQDPPWRERLSRLDHCPKSAHPLEHQGA